MRGTHRFAGHSARHHFVAKRGFSTFYAFINNWRCRTECSPVLFPERIDRVGPPIISSILTWIAQLASDSNDADVSNLPNVHLSLRYASDNNFMKKNVYGEFHQCFCTKWLPRNSKRPRARFKRRAGWKFLVFDCLRPRSIQAKLFDVVKGTPQQPYVANPSTGSIHNYGFAIDLSLEDENGHELDMGTGFDDFRPLSRPDHERENLMQGS